MSVEKRSRRDGSAVWVVRWREMGKQRARAFDLKRDAERFDIEMRRRRQLGHVVDRGRSSLSALHDEWWAMHASDLAPSTRKSYDGIWRSLIEPRLGSARLNEITPQAVEAWARKLRTDGTGEASVERAWVVLSGMLGRAASWGWIASNPVSLARRPRKTGTRRLPVMLTASQVESIRGRLDRGDACLVSVLAYAGLRPGEALALTWGDVGEERLSVSKAASLGETRTTKTGKSRSVRLLSPLRGDLVAWRLESRGSKEGDLVFPGPGGRLMHQDDWRRWSRVTFRNAATSAGLPRELRPYDLRHLFASLLIKSGSNVVEVAGQLGHSAGTCLGTYAHELEEFVGQPPIDVEAEIRRARRAA